MPEQGNNGTTENQNTAQQQGTENQDAGQAPQNWEQWLEAQPAQVKSLYEGHTKGLKSALDNERKQRDALQKQLAQLAKDTEKGSEARAAIEKMQAELSESGRRAEFYAEAHRNGVDDLDLAYLAAQRDGLISERGSIDFAALKKAHPKLFSEPQTQPRAVPTAHAGAGTGGTAPQVNDRDAMNRWMRAASGRVK